MSGHRIDPDVRPYDPADLPAKPEVEPADFFALDLRIGAVVAVEDFPEARKPALKLTVDFGPHVGTLRTSAQVTDHDPQDLVGRRVVGAVNLPDKRIAGFTSQFLVLGGLHADGRVSLLDTDVQLPPGSVVA